MKKILISTVFGLALISTGCATTSGTTAKTETVAEKQMKPEAKPKKKSNKKGLSQSFAASPEDVKAATIAAMQKYNFNFKNTDGMSLEGKRSNKVGLMVGSGGERMKAEITVLSDGMTEVHVQTKKTFVGIAGQKNWDDEVMELIVESLTN
jgi:hypothetical protein